jgi:hypothetical protein
MRLMLRVSSGLLLAVAGCRGDGSTDTTVPDSIQIVTATKQTTDINVTVRAHLKNPGGPGLYRLEFWGLPKVPNGRDTFYGETEPVEAASGYDDMRSWVINGRNISLGWVLAFSRDQGGARYRQTSRFDFR